MLRPLGPLIVGENPQMPSKLAPHWESSRPSLGSENIPSSGALGPGSAEGAFSTKKLAWCTSIEDYVSKVGFRSYLKPQQYLK